MTSVLVVYGSRHGGTRGIAERIGEVLTAAGLQAAVSPADRVRTVADIDAFVIGSGVYMGSWLKEPIEFIEREAAILSTHPVWLFSSGPLKGSIAEKPGVDPLEAALGPEAGPGSGGRKKVAELSAAIAPRGHAVFFGAFDPSDPPKGMSERFVRMMPGSKGLLPPGDYRDWNAIEAWANVIAAALSPAPARALSPAPAAQALSPAPAAHGAP
jgi:menaquinone-dependent protoporphyrinogen oxidase